MQQETQTTTDVRLLPIGDSVIVNASENVLEQVTQDGYIVNADGEITGHVEMPTGPWAPSTEDDIEWVLAKYGDQKSHESRFRARARAMQQEASASSKNAQWWLARFDADLRAFVLKYAPTKKKSVKLSHGTIRLRSVADRFTVTDQTAAVALARRIGRADLIVTKEIVSDEGALIEAAVARVGVVQEILGWFEKHPKHPRAQSPKNIESRDDANETLRLFKTAVDHVPAHESLSIDAGVSKVGASEDK